MSNLLGNITIRCKRQLDARDVVSCFYLYQTNGIESSFDVLCGSNFEAWKLVLSSCFNKIMLRATPPEEPRRECAHGYEMTTSNSSSKPH